MATKQGNSQRLKGKRGPHPWRRLAQFRQREFGKPPAHVESVEFLGTDASCTCQGIRALERYYADLDLAAAAREGLGRGRP